jgi:hypothetical protein
VGLVFNFISYAEEPTREQMLKSLEDMPKDRNIHLQEMLIREYKNRIGQEGYYDKVKLQEKEIGKVDSSVARILRRYKNIKTSEDMGSKFLMTNRLILDTVIGAGTALSGGTLGTTLIASAVGVVASKGLDQVEKKFRQAHRESAQRELKYQLYKLRESGMNLDRFDGMDAENAAKIIFKEDFENSIDNQDLQILNSARIKTLKDIIDNQGIKNLELQQATEEEIKKNRENLGELTKLYAEFGKQVRDDLVGIKEKQETINKKLKELNNRVNDNTRGIQKNRQDIEFIHEFMFGKMTPTEQRIALKKGWF